MSVEAKHTPGPWTSEDSEIHAADGLVAETVPLANDPQDVPGFGRAELANARLIAAAPELLEAAKAVLAGLNARIDAAPLTAVPVFHGIADLAAAIAKAENQPSAGRDEL